MTIASLKRTLERPTRKKKALAQPLGELWRLTGDALKSAKRQRRHSHPIDDDVKLYHLMYDEGRGRSSEDELTR
jgi:hypothetical protein